jgi:hypothetical protein
VALAKTAQRIDLLAAAARAVLNRHAQVKERQTLGASGNSVAGIVRSCWRAEANAAGTAGP